MFDWSLNLTLNESFEYLKIFLCIQVKVFFIVKWEKSLCERLFNYIRKNYRSIKTE